MTTPLLSLPEIAEGVANQVTLHNVALRHIEAKMIRALSMIVMAPPAAVDGDSYIIPAGASGAWSGKTGQIAAFIGGAWSYLVPPEDLRLWVSDAGAEYRFDGAAWVANGGGSVADHVAAEDPHTQYQKESEKGLANGYASLGADGKVPASQLPATTAQPFDIHLFYPGVPTASAILLDAEFARSVAFPANFAGAALKARVAAAAPVSIDVQKNGASVGTISFATGATSATFSTSGVALTFAAGDYLSLIAPATADVALANLRGVLAGLR